MALALLYQWRASANATELFVTHWRHAIGVIIQGRDGELQWAKPAARIRSGLLDITSWSSEVARPGYWLYGGAPRHRT